MFKRIKEFLFGKKAEYQVIDFNLKEIPLETLPAVKDAYIAPECEYSIPSVKTITLPALPPYVPPVSSKSIDEMTEAEIVKEYQDICVLVGQGVAGIPVGGEYIGFDKVVRRWEQVEKAYWNLGYIAMPTEILERVDWMGEEEIEAFKKTIVKKWTPDFPRMPPIAPIYIETYHGKIGQLEREREAATGKWAPVQVTTMDKAKSVVSNG